MNPTHPEPLPARRRFLQLLAFAGMSTVVGGAMAQTPSKTETPAAAPPPVTPARDSTAAQAPPPPSDEALALKQIVQKRYGEHLDAEQLAKVLEELEQRVQSGRRLRAVKFGNHEEPDFTFRV